MAFSIRLTDGTLLTTVEDGTINDTACSLTLIGKNYVGYGTIYNDNIVHLLENSSSDTAPADPLTGQLWWDKAGNLKVYSGENGFKTISTITSSSSSPTTAVTGNTWWDTQNEQLYVYNGTQWILVGPSFTAESGTSGVLVQTILDTESPAVAHVAVLVYVGSTLLGIYSKDSEFTPLYPIPGFVTIKPGFNFVSDTIVNDVKLWGTADNADNLGGYPAIDYVRAGGDVPLYTNSKSTSSPATPLRMLIPGNAAYATTTSSVTGAIKIRLPAAANNLGSMMTFRLTIFKNDDAAAGLGESTTFEIGGYNAAGGWDNCFATQLTAGGSDLNVRWGSDSTSDCIWIGDIGSTWEYPQVFVTDLQVGYSGTTAAIWDNGWEISFETSYNTVEIGPIVASKVWHGQTSNLPAADNVYNLGSADKRLATVYGVTFNGISNQAKYADLAERFQADHVYEPGTLVKLGGAKEITIETSDCSDDVFGVISSQPAYLMNNDLPNDAYHPPVAISGRVPVKVIGKVSKGDRLVSAGNGAARVAGRMEMTAFNVIGRSLENKDNNDISTIMAVVNINI